MSDEPKNDKPTIDNGSNAQTTAESKKPETNEHMIPKTRLDEEINKRKELEDRLSAMEKASKKAEEERLEEQGKYKDLAEQRLAEIEALKPKASVAEEQEQTLTAYLQAQIEDIPEAMRSLIPDELTTLQKLNFIAKNNSLLRKPSAPDIGAGQRGAGGGGSATITPELKRGAENFGLSEEQLKRAAKRLAEKQQ